MVISCWPGFAIVRLLNIVHFHFNVIPRALLVKEEASGNRQLQYSVWSGSGSHDLVDHIRRVTIDHDADGSDHKPVRCFMDGYMKNREAYTLVPNLLCIVVYWYR